ncbi:hypothetical protein GCM10019016_080280 [Streptomyces prasinosporus]|uniref:Secreted protein n=1 Tax=Streptomyces prasinosporus TaxID=68256 RepID=A0ABP6U3P2_9ACTN|nr:hypothetical protein GCM10010332_50490 [Streptomyces albogriseolus]
MKPWRQQTTRAAWQTTRTAGLCSALAVLLAALTVCLACLAPGNSDADTASLTAVSAAAMPADTSTDQHGSAVAHTADCPSGYVCCRPAVDGVRAVLATPAQPVAMALPRMPDLPRQPDALSLPELTAATDRAPNLHVLQVQRT